MRSAKLFVVHDHQTAVGMVGEAGGDTAEKEPLRDGEAAAAHHDQVGVNLVGNVEDRGVDGLVGAPDKPARTL